MSKRFDKIESEVGSQLPIECKTAIISSGGMTTFIFQGKTWKLVSPDGLLKPVQVGKIFTPYVRQLTAFVDVLESNSESRALFDSQGNAFLPDRLAAGIAIGDDGGDVLFLDPTDGFSVWAFWHDGTYVERLAASFVDWLENVQTELEYKEPTFEMAVAPLTICIESGIRAYLRNILPRRLGISYETFFRVVHGQEVLHPRDQETVTALASLLAQFHSWHPRQDKARRSELSAAIRALGNAIGRDR